MASTAAGALKTQGVGLSDTVYDTLPVFVPDSLRFHPVKQGLPARRVPVKFRAEQQTLSTDKNRLIRIKLPNNAFYDLRSGYLSASVAVAKTGGTYARIHNGAWCIFNRVRILAGATEVYDSRDYNRLFSIKWESQNDSDTAATVGMAFGIGTQAEREAAVAGGEYTYRFPLDIGLFTASLLPFDTIQNGLVLELYLEDPSTIIETNGTNPIVTVSNVEIYCERLELNQSFRNFLVKYIQDYGLEIAYSAWERYTNALNTGANQDITINQRSSSVNGIINILVNSAQISDTTVNDKLITWTPLTLTQSSVLINGTIFPDEPVNHSGDKFEPYQMYCRWLGKYKLDYISEHEPPIHLTDFRTDRFLQIDDFEAYPEVVGVANPFTTLRNNSTITKRMTFSGVIPANYQLDSWIEYFKRVTFFPDGRISVTQ